MLDRESIKDIVKLSEYVDISHVSYSKLDQCYFYHVDGTDYVIANEDYGGQSIWGIFETALTQNKRETVNMGMREVDKLNGDRTQSIPQSILHDTTCRLLNMYDVTPQSISHEDELLVEKYAQLYFANIPFNEDELKDIRRILKVAKGVSKWRMETSQ